jgi:hypothetical protein
MSSWLSILASNPGEQSRRAIPASNPGEQSRRNFAAFDRREHFADRHPHVAALSTGALEPAREPVLLCEFLGAPHELGAVHRPIIALKGAKIN